MTHILAVTIFLGALALALATIYWMIAANGAQIVTALLGRSGIETAPATTGYTRRNARFRISNINLVRNQVPLRQLAA